MQRLQTPIAALLVLLPLAGGCEDVQTSPPPVSQAAPAAPTPAEGSSTSLGDRSGASLAGAKRSAENLERKIEDQQKELIREMDRQLQDDP